MSKEAIKLALEALENLFGIPDKWTGEGGGDVAVWRLGGSYRAQQAITALREALAEQPAQQEQGDSICQEDDGCPTELAVLQRFWRGQSIPYEHYPTWCKPAPVPEAHEQEPVAWMRQDGQRVTTASDRHNYPDYETRYSIPLYTTPPQRTWVGLDLDERAACYKASGGNLSKFADQIEAKLKEKNT